MIVDLCTKLEDFLKESLVKLEQKHQIDKSGIHRIELLGDCSRTPIFHEIIKRVYQKDSLNRTMHSTEAIAKGACILAAIREGQISNVYEFQPLNQEE